MESATIINDLNEVNFTAIDFETANEQRNSICSIGIVIVKKGNITDKFKFLIKPKELRFSDINKRIHGICDQDVMNAPEFNMVWEQINPLIASQIILAHNTNFDVDVLKQTLNLYNLQIPGFKYICTQKLAQESFPDLQNYRLNDVAVYFGLNLNHHDSVSDATIAAEIGIRAIPIYDKLKYSYKFDELTLNILKKSSKEKKDSYSSSFDKKSINSTVLIPNLEAVVNRDNPFYNKKVVFTGDMKGLNREEAALIIQKLGADINTTISKKTEIVIIGVGTGPVKMKKVGDLKSEGYAIRLIFEEEFLTLIKQL